MRIFNLDGQLISDFERDDLHREVLRTQGALTSCFGYDAMGRKSWQFASRLSAEKLSRIHNPGIQPDLLVEHAFNPNVWIDPWGWAFKGVDFTGSPDLFPVTGNQKNIVSITMQGARGRDFTQAYKEAGIKASVADDYTWHHVDDFDPETGKTTMQLIKTSAHEATFPHGGSVAQFEKHFGLPSGAYGNTDAVGISHSKWWLKGRAPKATSTTC